MLSQAIYSCTGPVAVRYPRGGDGKYIETAEKYVIREGSDLTLVSYGIMINEVLEAAELLSRHGIQAEVLKLNAISPLPIKPIIKSVNKTGALFVVEDCADQCGVAHDMFSRLAQQDIRARFACRNFGDRFISHGSTHQLFRDSGLDGESLSRWVMEALSHG